MTLLISGPFLDRLLTKQNVYSFEYTPKIVVSHENFGFMFFGIFMLVASTAKSVTDVAGFHCSLLSDLNLR